jgi:hypothetical protein
MTFCRTWACLCRSKICDAPESTIIVIDPGISFLHIQHISTYKQMKI